MVDYKAIADEAEKYSDYESAFNAMSQVTETKYGELSSNNLREWAVSNPIDYATIKDNGDVLTEMAMKQITIDSSPLDLRKASVRYMVSILPISEDGKANILKAGEVIVKKWTGLKAGHVQNALQKRAKGTV